MVKEGAKKHRSVMRTHPPIINGPLYLRENFDQSDYATRFQFLLWPLDRIKQDGIFHYSNTSAA